MTFLSPSLPDPIRDAAVYDRVTLKRGLAWIIDTLFIALITALIVPFTAFTALFYLSALYMAVGFLYRWIGMARKSGTPGMRLLGVMFLDRQGMPLDAGTALAHTLGYTLSVVFMIPQLVSVVLMLFSARGQGLTDMLLGTVAINRRYYR